MKLHLGCGYNKLEGYINCDISKEVNPDKVLNIEYPLPFKDDSVEEIIAEHVLEHINNFITLMHELRRICKNGAKIIIKTPFYSSWGQFNDPTHVRFFTPFTFDYFHPNKYSHEVECDERMFNVKCKINYAVGRLKFLNKIFNPLINLSQAFYCGFFAWTFPASELIFELEVIK